MTVKELIAKLSNLDQDLEVVIQWDDDGGYHSTDSVSAKDDGRVTMVSINWAE